MKKNTIEKIKKLQESLSLQKNKSKKVIYSLKKISHVKDLEMELAQ